jgi:curved DNA-binding protein CbpA
MDDHYKKLQVDPQAESEVIRAAYYALARKYHPDAGGDAGRMVEFNAAWAVLGDRLRRSAYDAERDGPIAPSATSGPADRHGSSVPARDDRPVRTRQDTSTVLDFGRYEGWSLEQIVKSNPDYLDWLVRTSIGRRLSAEVMALREVREPKPSAFGMATGHTRNGTPLADRRTGKAGERHWFGRAMPGRG